MTKRPRSHIIDKQSRNRLHEIFTNVGWVVQDINPDYGEDLLVRIFDNEMATPYTFYVQIKGTDHINNFLSKEKVVFTVPGISSRLAKQWVKFWEPVILALWDSSTNTIYWQYVQHFLETDIGRKAISNKKESLSIPISKNNILDISSTSIIADIAVDRYNRFEHEQQGAEVLIQIFKERFNIGIEYDSQAGLAIINWPERMPEIPKSGTEHVIFGKLLAKVEALERKLGLNGNQVLEKAIDELHDLMYNSFTQGYYLAVIDHNGKVIDILRSPEDLKAYQRKNKSTIPFILSHSEHRLIRIKKSDIDQLSD